MTKYKPKILEILKDPDPFLRKTANTVNVVKIKELQELIADMILTMREYKKDPLRSQARRDIIRALGEKDIANKKELVEITNLSPLTINAILREFRNYQIITCHAGGLYALSGEGREFYLQLLSDKKYRKREYERRMSSAWSEPEVVHRRTIYIGEDEEETTEEESNQE